MPCRQSNVPNCGPTDACPAAAAALRLCAPKSQAASHGPSFCQSKSLARWSESESACQCRVMVTVSLSAASALLGVPVHNDVVGCNPAGPESEGGVAVRLCTARAASAEAAPPHLRD